MDVSVALSAAYAVLCRGLMFTGGGGGDDGSAQGLGKKNETNET
jgi:hypothetical protein